MPPEPPASITTNSAAIEIPTIGTNQTSNSVESTQPSSSTIVASEAKSEVASMLPANHVIQYSPRLASNNTSSVQWSQRPQQYDVDVVHAVQQLEP